MKIACTMQKKNVYKGQKLYKSILQGPYWSSQKFGREVIRSQSTKNRENKNDFVVDRNLPGTCLTLSHKVLQAILLAVSHNTWGVTLVESASYR